MTADVNIYDILNDHFMSWDMMIDEFQQRLEIHDTADQYSEEAYDSSQELNERTDYTNMAIMNP
ncbi:unnamed protein product, partial [Rotaria magnacalcarata]